MDVVYSPAFRGFSVDVAGNVAVILVDDLTTTVVITVLAGVVYAMHVVQFVTTGTTATGLHAWS